MATLIALDSTDWAVTTPSGLFDASPGAMQLRTLQTIDGLGPTASNTVVIGIPMELMGVLGSLAKAKDLPAPQA